MLRTLSKSDGCVTNSNNSPVIQLGNNLDIGEKAYALLDITCGKGTSAVEIKQVELTTVDGAALDDRNFRIVGLYSPNAAGTDEPVTLPFVINSEGVHTELLARVVFNADRPTGAIDFDPHKGPAVRIASSALAVTVPFQGTVLRCPSGYGDCDDNPTNCETNLMTTVAHCGACATKENQKYNCLSTRTQATCVEGDCLDCLTETTSDNSCDTATNAGSVGIGSAVTREGNIVPLDDVDYFKVSFAGSGDCTAFHPLITVDNENVKFDVLESNGKTCTETAVACTEEGSNLSTHLSRWESKCQYSTYDFLLSADSITFIGTTMYVKVYAASAQPTPSCLPYTLTFSNNHTP